MSCMVPMCVSDCGGLKQIKAGEVHPLLNFYLHMADYSVWTGIKWMCVNSGSASCYPTRFWGPAQHLAISAPILPTLRHYCCYTTKYFWRHPISSTYTGTRPCLSHLFNRSWSLLSSWSKWRKLKTKELTNFHHCTFYVCKSISRINANEKETFHLKDYTVLK